MSKYIAMALLALIMLSACTKTEKLDLGNNLPEVNNDSTTSILAENEYGPDVYNPKINPQDFSANVNNKYFSLIPGNKWVYEGKTKEGTERNEVYVTDQVKYVMGVPNIVVWDRVWLDGDLIEETYDWYSQDEEGNVWYFGEDSKEIYQGEVQNTDGSWESGINGALPGIYMKANPKVGDSYYQESLKGEAEDRAEVLATDISVMVYLNSYDGCIKTRDHTELDLSADEHKIYCPQVGNVVQELGLEDGEKLQLISFERNSLPSESKPAVTAVSTGTVSESAAIEIALTQVPGKVTDVAKETKNGKKCYAIEIQPSDGEPETDVFVEVATGAIVAIED